VLEEALTTKKKELEKIIAETEKEEKALSTESDKAKEKVEPRLLSAYERIRKSYRNGLAVVPVLRDSCGGCFNIIPPQRQSEIRQRKKIIVCEHCGRILVDTDLNEQVKIKG
jgi:predicted  nucleic acid-binding Zn-ribbon protein